MSQPFIIVNTCLRFKDIAVPKLLESLRAARVPMDRVIVVVGEADEDGPASGAGPIEVPVRSASMDNNALLFLLSPEGRRLVPDDAYAFYVHDTCAVHTDFWSRVTGLLRDRIVPSGIDAAPVCRFPSMNIGFYRVSALRAPAVHDALDKARNDDRSPGAVLNFKRALHLCEDYAFKLVAQNGGHLQFLQQERRNGSSKVQLYGTDTLRTTEEFDTVGLVKFKANNGEKPLHLQL